jgi:aspartyl-tRNA(Asn)/glutamyl-tRNA(Gln) amidotransferase subunit A
MEFDYFFRNPDLPAIDDGPLKGLNIAIQPNIAVKGWPSDAGSRALSGYTALEDSTVIKRVKDAGAYIGGSTRMSEFGFGLNESHAGEAVKQGVADADLLLDMTGEARVAAAERGVPGYKPSYGLISRLGLTNLIPSMESCGVTSKNIQNIRNILAVIAGQDGLDFSMPDTDRPDFRKREILPAKTTIGLITEAVNMLPEKERGLFQASINSLKDSGFIIREFSLPDFHLFSLVHSIAGSVEASSCAGRYDSVRYGERAPGAKNWNEMYIKSRGAAFGSLLKCFLIQGAYFQFEQYRSFEDACRIRARLLKEMDNIYSHADFLVFPALNPTGTEETEGLSSIYKRFSFTLFANVTGQPVLCLPVASGAGLPGVQLAGPRNSDAGVLTLGEYILNRRDGGK